MNITKILQSLWLQDRFDLTILAASEAFDLPQNMITSANRSERAVYARWAIIETLVPVMGPAAIHYLAKNLNRTTYSIRNAINDYHGNTRSRDKYKQHKPRFEECLERILDRNVPGATRDEIAREEGLQSAFQIKLHSARRDPDGPGEGDEQTWTLSEPVADVRERNGCSQDVHQPQLRPKHSARPQASL